MLSTKLLVKVGRIERTGWGGAKIKGTIHTGEEETVAIVWFV